MQVLGSADAFLVSLLPLLSHRVREYQADTAGNLLTEACMKSTNRQIRNLCTVCNTPESGKVLPNKRLLLSWLHTF
jgi:hypothetical protein